MIFLIINRPNFLLLLVDHRFLPSVPVLNFYEASRFVRHRMDAPGRHNGQKDVSIGVPRILQRRGFTGVDGWMQKFSKRGPR